MRCDDWDDNICVRLSALMAAILLTYRRYIYIKDVLYVYIIHIYIPARQTNLFCPINFQLTRHKDFPFVLVLLNRNKYLYQ